MAVKVINPSERSVHRLGGEERHFVLCWKYLGTICGFEVEETFFFSLFNYWDTFSFACWNSQEQWNIPVLEQLFTYNRLLKD